MAKRRIPVAAMVVSMPFGCIVNAPHQREAPLLRTHMLGNALQRYSRDFSGTNPCMVSAMPPPHKDGTYAWPFCLAGRPACPPVMATSPFLVLALGSTGLGRIAAQARLLPPTCWPPPRPPAARNISGSLASLSARCRVGTIHFTGPSPPA